MWPWKALEEITKGDAPRLGASAISQLLVKFSRFHSSQQCDGRKADGGIIAYFPSLRGDNLHTSPFLPCVSFRENRHTKHVAKFVPMQNMPQRQRFSAQNLSTGKNQSGLCLTQQSEKHSGAGEGVIKGVVAVDAVDVECFNQVCKRVAVQSRA